MPNRLQSGFLSFKLGVTGHISYAYQVFTVDNKRDPYDNFIRGPGYGMTYPARNPTSEKVTVKTLAREGIREGIVDYKYLYTLSELAREAREKGLAQSADEAQSAIEFILAQIPWRGESNFVSDGITRTRLIDNDQADILRAMIAQSIMKTQEALK